MKKFSFLLTSGLIIALITFFLLPIAVAQDPPPLPPDIEGEWEFHITIIDKNWYGERDIEVHSGTFEIESTGLNTNTDPNYIIDLPETNDDFYGFVHDGIFAFYKENMDNCGGEGNFGREMIVGTVNKRGTNMSGKGMGFDSKPDCGGTWSYNFTAQKISE